jgi:hypothetical protein
MASEILEDLVTELNTQLGLLGEIGAGDRDRTGDIQLGKLAFYR